MYPGKNIRMLYSDRIRKAKAQLEPNLAGDVKNNKGFHRYVGEKGKIKENTCPQISKTGEIVTTGMEKAEVLNNLFALVFNGNLSSHVSQAPETQGRDWSKDVSSI